MLLLKVKNWADQEKMNREEIKAKQKVWVEKYNKTKSKALKKTYYIKIMEYEDILEQLR